MNGHLVVDPTDFTPEQTTELEGRAANHGGWRHPDGVRWIIPTEHPTHTKERLVEDGWPLEAITVAR